MDLQGFKAYKYGNRFIHTDICVCMFGFIGLDNRQTDIPGIQQIQRDDIL
jgi:hypothetical protein